MGRKRVKALLPAYGEVVIGWHVFGVIRIPVLDHVHHGKALGVIPGRYFRASKLLYRQALPDA